MMMIMISSNFIFKFTSFCIKLLTLVILLSAALRVVVADKLVILGISPLNSSILALREAFVSKLAILGISPLTSFILVLKETLVAKLEISGILSSIFFILALYTFF